MLCINREIMHLFQVNKIIEEQVSLVRKASFIDITKSNEFILTGAIVGHSAGANSMQ